MHRRVLHVEAGVWGMAGFTPQKELATVDFPEEPVVGQVVQVRGEEYLVTSVTDDSCLVRPRKTKLF